MLSPPLPEAVYDVAIVGGGLAGLALAIQLKRKDYNVILFEKEEYPFHKVCGEYISLESWDFLVDLGVNLDAINIPIITKLQVSSVKGKMLEQLLPLGGFGISRYLLDNNLAKIAQSEGIIIMQNTKVNDILYKGGMFIIDTSLHQYRSRIACGSFGKRSNLDIKWKRPFAETAKNKLNNYIGVKYHIQVDFPEDTIALHNFENGYCGIVKVEKEKYNLCYMTTAENLKKNNGDIKKMEETILFKNPHLKKIFTACRHVNDKPITISQISFDKKNLIENHVLMLGDAAGMITPLCGNGMSMALHASKMTAIHIDDYLQNKITQDEMEKNYSLQWNREFGHRLITGRRIQRLFGNKWMSNFFIAIIKPFPGLVSTLVKQTHGKPF